jgi:hypothetical protein
VLGRGGCGVRCCFAHFPVWLFVQHFLSASPALKISLSWRIATPRTVGWSERVSLGDRGEIRETCFKRHEKGSERSLS